VSTTPGTGTTDRSAAPPSAAGGRRRGALAARAAVAVGSTSRRLRLGSGSVVGGRVGLRIDPGLLERLAAGRAVALVSGTNGKTTTTRLLAAAAQAQHGAVATSDAGANLPAGVVAALAAQPAGPAVLEVDEAHLPAVADAVRPSAVVLLNLSRDQLDRVAEVRALATRWRAAAARLGEAVVVANADDPLVVWAALPAHHVVWVAAGLRWRADAGGCPSCAGRIVHRDDGWGCPTCGLSRPDPDVAVEDSAVRWRDGRVDELVLALPGRHNVANAAMALAAAPVLGIDRAVAATAMAAVREVAGRYTVVDVDGVGVRLLLAKNPAGWGELLDLLAGPARPVVLGINAEVADGRDPSWLWDVAFERLAGRLVLATGRRALDLSVRLRHAGIEHRVVPDQRAAVAAAVAAAKGSGSGSRDGDADDHRPASGLDGHRPASGPDGHRPASGPDGHRPASVPEDAPAVDYAGNYTAFQQLRQEVTASRHLRVGAVLGRRGRHPDRELEVASDPAPSAPSVPAAGRRSDGVSALRIAVVHPDLLGTYGDGGNAVVLANRARWRGTAVEVLVVEAGRPVPSSADVYLLGGGEDGPQEEAAELLAGGALADAVARGATVLAVCAGFQLVGRSFPGADGTPRPGLGLLDVVTERRSGRRAVGEVVAEPVEPPAHGDAVAVQAAALLAAAGPLTGFENHGGATRLGDGVRPLATVTRGIGNDGRGTEGAWAGKVIGTYLHGPVLARNPALADAVLTLATGTVPAPLPDVAEQALRRERLRASGIRSAGRH
jgi:CobQ-like glutamine amidotransferase family enzyme/UDP-N-acetylmuramyl tripeptide synthase